jgi:hypothetical protein
MDMSQILLITTLAIVTTLGILSIYNSPSWPLLVGKNHHLSITAHTILASYATPYMSCVATLKKKKDCIRDMKGWTWIILDT